MALRTALTALALAALVALAGCGVRGPLEPPPGAVDDRDAAATPPGTSTEKAHEPFVLDPLL
jgi:predicted small lipoprotein YifL